MVFAFVQQKCCSSQNLLGCFRFVVFVDFLAPMCPCQVQPLCGQGWWVPSSFDLYPNSPQCFPLNGNVSILSIRVDPLTPITPSYWTVLQLVFTCLALKAPLGYGWMDIGWEPTRLRPAWSADSGRTSVSGFFEVLDLLPFALPVMVVFQHERKVQGLTPGHGIRMNDS